MTAYYPNLKPGYMDVLKRPGTTVPTQPGIPAPQPPAPTNAPSNQWQVPQVKPVTQTYQSQLPAITPPAGHPSSDLGANAYSVAQNAGKAQQTAQGAAMAGASSNPSVPVTHGHPTTDLGANAFKAANAAGQAQEKANAGAMATASAGPSQAAGGAPVPDYRILRDPGALTESGKTYNQYVEDVLSGKRAISGVDSARSDAERRNALNYTHTLQQAQEAAAQSGLQPGTAGYQRIMSEALAGISGQNLDRTNSVNQLQRQAYQDMLGLGKGIEDSARANATSERTYQTEQADKTYNRSKADTLQTQTQELAAINSIEDPKARQAALNQYLASQKQGNYSSVLGLFNPDGSLKPEYASMNPAQQSYQQRIQELKAYYPEKSDAEIQAMAQQERAQERVITQNPIQQATSAAEQQSIQEKMRLGQPLTDAEKKSAIAKGTIPEFTPANMPRHPDAIKDLVGKLVNIGGKLYTVIKGDTERTGAGTFRTQERHTDYATVQDEQGNTKYVYDGKINDNPPKQVSNDWTPWGF